MSDTSDAVIYAYKLDLNADRTLGGDFGARDSDKDITLASANTDPTGIWSDGDTMWVADWFGQRAYAYALVGSAREADLEFELGAGPRALWSDGTTMWAMTSAGKKIYSYRMPGSTDASLSSLSLSGITLQPAFSAETTTYTANVAGDFSTTTVSAVTTDPAATAVIELGGVEDADGTVELAEGGNVITVEVTAPDGTATQTYTVTVTRAAVANNAPEFAVDQAILTVPENSAADTVVGTVTATDDDDDTLTYSLEGTDAASVRH